MKFLCAGADLADACSRGFEIDGQKLFAVRRSGQVYVYINRCPHRGVGLEWTRTSFSTPATA